MSEPLTDERLREALAFILENTEMKSTTYNEDHKRVGELVGSQEIIEAAFAELAALRQNHESANQTNAVLVKRLAKTMAELAELRKYMKVDGDGLLPDSSYLSVSFTALEQLLAAAEAAEAAGATMTPQGLAWQADSLYMQKVDELIKAQREVAAWKQDAERYAANAAYWQRQAERYERALREIEAKSSYIDATATGNRKVVVGTLGQIAQEALAPDHFADVRNMVTQPKELCETCDGVGVIAYAAKIDKGYPCPDCNGTGRKA